jgi:hypothetical protein
MTWINNIVNYQVLLDIFSIAPLLFFEIISFLVENFK